MRYYKKLIASSFWMSSLLLTACGGGGGDQSTNYTTNPAQSPFTTAFSGTLTIQHDGQAAQKINNRLTSQNDDTNAYSVETVLASVPVSTSNLDNISLSYSQKLVFQLDAVPDQKVLSFNYNPINKQFTDVAYTELSKDQNGTATIYYSCAYNEELALPCQNIKMQFDADSGQSEFVFDHTALRSSRDNELITFNGKLTGRLSIAPQQLSDIPKSTNDNIQLNGKNLPVIAATYSYQIDISEVLFADGKKLLLRRDGEQQLQSQIYQPDHSDVFNGKFYVLQDASKLTSQEQPASKTVQFNQAAYQFSPVASQTADPEQYIIDGSIDISSPTQSLNMSSWYTKQDYSWKSTPNRVNITLVNHNEKILESNGVEVHLRNNKLYSIHYSDLTLNPSTSSIIQLVDLDYQCNPSHACKNASVEPNGFGVKFNNTPLYATTNSNDMNSVITLNGGLIYTGR